MLHRGRTTYIKQKALEYGFSFCGIAPAQYLNDDARRLETWLSSGMHGKMQYMENYFDLRVDPTKLVPGARSVITLLMNYYPEKTQPASLPQVSKYAYGEDYHDVIRSKIKSMLQDIRNNIGEINGRGFVDSAPVLERAWAQKSGLGWIGKNGNLISKQQGSFFFIATLITDLELDYDEAYPNNYCGTCTRCIDACPTDAILPGNVVDGSRCISYFTIELKDALIPENMSEKFGHWLFGCDVCQDVCPWNRFSKTTDEKRFQPIFEIMQYNKKDWEEITEDQFKKIFAHSPIKRSKYDGIRRNLQLIK